MTCAHRIEPPSYGFILAMFVLSILPGCGLLFGSRTNANSARAQAETDLKVLEERILVWRRAHGELPHSLTQVRLSTDANREWPTDPWGRPYVFEQGPGRHGFLIRSLGRDGVPGGEGEDADLTNDQLAP